MFLTRIAWVSLVRAVAVLMAASPAVSAIKAKASESAVLVYIDNDIQGGYLDDSIGRVSGNPDYGTDFNFVFDPEAAHIVLTAPWPRVTIVSDVTTPVKVTHEILERIGKSGSPVARYVAEFFWNPTATIRDVGLSYAQVQAGILRGMADAETDFGICSLLIPAIDREADVAEANEMVRLVIANRDEAVAGIGIDYRETDRPPELFGEAFRMAKAAGLRTTAHAGEFGAAWTNVATVIDELQVDRVDHGYTVIDNSELVKRCVEKGMVFTIVPTNSYYMRTLEPERWAIDHPIRRMVELRLKVHPNTDDPTLHDVSPAGTWELMYSHFGYAARDLRTMMLNGIDGSWADEDRKRTWRTQWTVEFDSLAMAAF
jgi:adenosine deaminase